MSVVEGEAYLAEKRAWLKILLANATSYAARRASRGVFTAYDSFNLQSIEHEKDMLRLFDELIDLLQQNQQNP